MSSNILTTQCVNSPHLYFYIIFKINSESNNSEVCTRTDLDLILELYQNSRSDGTFRRIKWISMNLLVTRSWSLSDLHIIKFNNIFHDIHMKYFRI